MTAQLIEQLKANGQDHEFYPTTKEILDAAIRDINLYRDDYDRQANISSVLDIGAGNGKALKAFKSGVESVNELYAIEKSLILCNQLDESIFIVGTDLMQQSLLAKTVDMIFCNPPYSEYEAWAVKIIREAASRLVYLVIPRRWKNCQAIKEAISFREAKVKSIGQFTFEDSEDREARAIVDLLRIEYTENKDDAFDSFFHEQFSELIEKFNGEMNKRDDEDRDELRRAKEESEKQTVGLMTGADLQTRMVMMYQQQLDHIRANYAAVCKLDASLLKEFGVYPGNVKVALRDKLDNLRKLYWQSLFSRMTNVTNRMTSKKRRLMLESLNKSGAVDFTMENIYAVVLWVMKHANKSFDSQLIDVFEQMLSKANTRNYKSNLKPYVEDRWRYNQEKPTHVALEYRLVLHYMGGIKKTCFDFERGLDTRAAEFIQDLLTVAMNLGFTCDTADRRLDRTAKKEWTSGAKQIFWSGSGADSEQLIEVRAFENGNMHIRLGQDFALALNVEYGRLKGWLKNPSAAADELDDKKAPTYFGTNHSITDSARLLCA